MGLLGGIARGVNARSAVQRIHLQTGVVGHDDLSRRVAAIFFRLLARVRFEGEAVFDHGRQGSEVWNAGNFDSVRCGRSGKVSQLSGIRCRNQNSSHRVRTITLTTEGTEITEEFLSL